MQRPRPPQPGASGLPATHCKPAPLLTAVLLAFAAACSKPAAWGEANSLILIASDDVWSLIEDTTYTVLEPTIITTREEKKFNVTQVDPGSPELEDLLVFRQVLVLGTPDSPLVQRAADEAGVESLEASSVFTAGDVWARGQVVTVVVAEAGREADTWREVAGDLIQLIDERYREYVLERMFVSGVDSAVADSVRGRFGFSLQVPMVYQLVIREGPRDTVVILRNDNPDPSELIRSVLITWRPRLLELGAEVALDWRTAIDSVHYNVPQRAEPADVPPRSLMVDGKEGLEVTGTWVDEGSFPAAGPYINWLVQCPDRTLFIDAWLYAPRKPKYEYMLQLRQILNSFTCTEPGSP